MTGHTVKTPARIRCKNEFKSAFSLMLLNPKNKFWRNRAYYAFLALCKGTLIFKGN